MSSMSDLRCTSISWLNLDFPNKDTNINVPNMHIGRGKLYIVILIDQIEYDFDENPNGLKSSAQKSYHTLQASIAKGGKNWSKCLHTSLCVG